MKTGTVEPPAGALRWLGELLGGAGIPFLVAGEVAAVAHGAARSPAAGIEAFVAAADLPRLLRLAGAHVAEAPWRRRDDDWDRIAVVLEHDGVRITVALGEAARVRDVATGGWVDASVDLDASEVRTVWGVAVPVMAREQLAGLERRLGRAVDRLAVSRSDGGGGQ